MTDTQSLEALIAHSKPIILAAAKRYLLSGRAEEVEDVLQEVYLKLFKLWKKRELGRINKLDVFLYTIAKNQCLTWNRTHQRTGPLANEADIEAPIPDLSPESREALHQAIATMSPLYQTLVYRILDGFTLRELSQQLSMSLNTLKAQFRRARKHLLTQLSKEEESQ